MHSIRECPIRRSYYILCLKGTGGVGRKRKASTKSNDQTTKKTTRTHAPHARTHAHTHTHTHARTHARTHKQKKKDAINGSGPAYLSELLHVYTPSRTLRSSSGTRMLKIQQYKRKTHMLALVPSLALDPPPPHTHTHTLALDPTFGIHCYRTLDTAEPCHLLKPN